MGIRIGVNGTEASVGQSYIPLNTTITTANYSATAGQLLSSVGAVIALQKGPASDQFFLTFAQIGLADACVHGTDLPPSRRRSRVPQLRIWACAP